MDKWLERATNLSVLASAVLFAAVVVNSWRAQPSSRQLQSPRYSVGDRLADMDPRVDFSAASRTVLLYVNSNCQFCVVSAPFYRRLVAHRNELAPPVRIIAIAKQPEGVLKSFLSVHGIVVDRAVALSDSSTFTMKTTPAVLVVNRTGTIDSLWIGQIAAEDEEAALRAVVAH